MISVSGLAEVAYSWGRWSAVLALFLVFVYRNRREIQATAFAREIAIGVVAYFAYFFVRGLTEGDEARAIANAHAIVDLERQLGIFVEQDLQSWIIDNRALVTIFNWGYIWGHWPVIVLAGAWLYIHRPATYRVFRNAFLVSGAIGLVIFAIYPVAPPRLTELDVVDTVTTYSEAYRVLQPPALVNQYAAVPSLHFGWNLLVGIALFSEMRSPQARLLALALPAIMLASIVFTANHYILDAVAGAAVALAGLAIAQRFFGQDERTAQPQPFPRVRN